jgi:hypothetical protein
VSIQFHRHPRRADCVIAILIRVIPCISTATLTKRHNMNEGFETDFVGVAQIAAQ